MAGNRDLAAHSQGSTRQADQQGGTRRDPRLRARRGLILDSSAVVAILRGEPDRLVFVAKALGADLVAIGAPTLFETEMVSVSRSGDSGRKALARFLKRFSVELIPFDGSHSLVAIDVFERYGKGRHPAALNYGDCMTYATARVAGLPLLFKGGDFARTDIDVA